MQVSKRNNNLIISFDYDPYLVEVVRQLGNRKFDNRNKVWTVPLSQIDTVVNRLTPAGFKFDNDVMTVYEKRQKKIARLERLRAGEFNPIEQEKILETKLPLFPYQMSGTGFMCAAQNALNGDEPGLGKSIQSIAATKILGCEKVLVLTFATLKGTWEEEIKKWLPDAEAIVVKGEKKYRDKKWAKDANFYIANYELLLRDLPEIQNIKWDAIIADEATRIANPRAKTTIAIKKINARFKFPLTGTPLNNSVQDVWSIIDFCEGGAMGTYWQFLDKYCELDVWKNVKGYKNLGILKQELRPYFIRRLKKEVLSQLPDKLYDSIYVDLSQEEREFYAAVKNEIIEELKDLGMKDRRGLSNVMTKMLRLQQATDSLSLVSKESKKSTKLDSLKELLEIVCAGENKAIVFTKFRQMAYILMEELKEYTPLLIAGGVKEDERDVNKKLFNEEAKHRVLVMTDAGAFGLNLQSASSVIHYDLPWSITKTQQREDRAHRIGQKGNVTVYKMIAKDTIDEYVLKVLHQKQRTAERVLGDNDKLRKQRVSKAMLQKLLQ